MYRVILWFTAASERHLEKNAFRGQIPLLEKPFVAICWGLNHILTRLVRPSGCVTCNGYFCLGVSILCITSL
jgi:hypothetical protein